ncbi:helix-turn-helix domain-containing protein [Emticicia sp. TH156]|uniref:helix-turn-helix domain-containing protein n=1 Tax=Emticicia sp. TH156 TaxID=2067454 RepID=UPI000C77310C|nr:helix-turn-helix domain-containing protein [Emticicia sp. TH156]PLK44324.1 hypothetical protein C0V77_11060 [Emticicia sp. TH156]
MNMSATAISGTEIRSFRKKNKLSQTEFAELVGVSMRAVQLWESGDRNVSSLAERTIKEVFQTYKPKEATGSKSRNIHTFVNNENGDLIVQAPLLGAEAFARYLDELGEAGALQSDEMVSFIVDKIDRGNFVAFRISGDSMNGGLIDDTPDRAIVLGKELPMDLWMNGFGESKFGWVILTKRNVLFKDIVGFDKETATITCHSRNDSPEYADFKLSLNDVHKIFKVIKRSF